MIWARARVWFGMFGGHLGVVFICIWEGVIFDGGMCDGRRVCVLFVRRETLEIID
jgi:hypothetical protein